MMKHPMIAFLHRLFVRSKIFGAGSSARKRRSLIRALAICAAAAALVRIVDAADVSWINAGGGAFNTGSNWSNGAPPGPNDNANFSLPGSYVVTWNNSVGDTVNLRLRVTDGDVTFVANAGDFTHSVVSQPTIGGGFASVSQGRLALGGLSGGTFSLEVSDSLEVIDSGSMDVGFGAEVLVEGSASVRDFSNVSLSNGGTLEAKTLFLPGGIFHVDGLNSVLNVQTLNISEFGSIRVKNGGQARAAFASLGGFDADSGFGSVSGTGSIFQADRLLLGNSSQAQLDVVDGAVLITPGTTDLGINAGLATVSIGEIQGTGTTSNWNAGSIFVGGSGNGRIFALSGGAINALSMTVFSQGTLSLSGGSVTAGTLELRGGALRLNSGAIEVTDPDAIFRLPAESLASGLLELDATRRLHVAGTTIIEPGVMLRASDPNSFASGRVINNGKMDVFATALTLGETETHGAFAGSGELSLVISSLTLNDAGYADLGHLTTLQGSTLHASNGIALPTGGDLVGSGVVSAKIAAAIGSSIVAQNGGLTLGDETAFDGFVSAGHLDAGSQTVTLRDRNQATLGTLTSLSGGTVVADNGVILDLGGAIAGAGTITSANDPLRPTIINGSIVGENPSQRLTLTGYVKGVGTFDNVTFTGTHSPGLSLTRLDAGNISYRDTATLLIEVGNDASGYAFDQVNSNGLLELGGTLELQLIDGFVPSAGRTFDILNWGSLAGTFDSINVPALTGLVWDTSQLYETGVISIVAPTLPGDYNQNGTVDAADYTVWRDTLGSTTNLTADGSGNGVVDQADYDLWKSHFGSTLATANLQWQIVPELSGMALIAFTAFVGALRVTWLIAKSRRR